MSKQKQLLLTERHREKMREYRRKNRERIRIYHEIRRTQKLGLPSSFGLDDWAFAKAWFGGCAACGRVEHLVMDHWIPVAHSDCPGTVAENIIPLCWICNTYKGSLEAEKWLWQRFGDEVATRVLAEVNEYFEAVRRG